MILGTHARPTHPLGAVLFGLFASSSLASGGLFQEPITLDTPNPEGAGGWFGASVTWVPDVNGDGKVEILVGAPHEDPGDSPTHAGRAYLFDGASRSLLREFNLVPEAANREFGFTVAGIEDVNGDGRGDVIIGTGSGAAYVFDGGTGSRLFQVSGGRSFGAVPDANGDGRSDIVASDHASVRLLDGATGQQLWRMSNPNLRTGSVNNSTLFGFSVSGIPDLNGDGRGDVIVGAPYEDLPLTADRPKALLDAGRVYVFDGAGGTLLHQLTSPDERVDSQFGRGVVGVPDLNGDGCGDFAIIQVGVGGPPGVSGRVYIYDGATGQVLRRTELVPPTNGETGNGFDFLRVVPDVIGDRQAEFLVAGWNNGDPRYYLFDGASSALIATLPYFAEPSISPMSGIPDLNGDGRGEVLISAAYDSQLHLFLSDGPPLPPTPSVAGFGNDGFLVRLTGEPGMTYELQVSDDLVSWTTLLKGAQANPVTEFLDVEAKNHPRGFYRTRTGSPSSQTSPPTSHRLTRTAPRRPSPRRGSSQGEALPRGNGARASRPQPFAQSDPDQAPRALMDGA